MSKFLSKTGLSALWNNIKNTFAKQEGEYPNLIAGHAKNLDGIKENINSSGYRPVAGNDDIKNGAGSIERIQGNSVAWNQLVQNGNFANGVTRWNIHNNSCTANVSSGVVTITRANSNTPATLFNTISEKPIEKHVYLLKASCYRSSNTEAFNSNFSGSNAITKNINVWENLYCIAKVPENNFGYLQFQLRDGQYKNCMAFDLTLIYGIGNEPTTPEQFEADYQRWFGRTLDYEEYDAGSIRTTLATGIKTVGFNLSNIDSFEGHSRDWYQNNERILWKNDCGYKGQIRCSMSVLSDVVDVGQSGKYAFPSIVIKYTDETTENTKNNIVDINNVVFPYTGVVTSNPNKIIKEVRTTFSFWGTIKISNICINFVHSGIRNGDYEPHWEETKALPVTTLTGKLDGKGESVVIFPDGLKRAGTIYDEIYEENGVTKAVKRVGSVDLGTLTWTYDRDSVRFRSNDIDCCSQEWTVRNNALNDKYTRAEPYTGNVNTLDKAIGISSSHVFVRDTSYNGDTNAFKTGVKGYILYYELAEPQTYIVDNFELPAVYKVDDFGTEEIIQPINSIALTMTIKYGLNAVDTCRRLPERVNNIENLVEELKNANKDKEVVVFTCSLNYDNEKAYANVNRIDPTKQVFYLIDTFSTRATIIPLTACAMGSSNNDHVAFVGMYYPVNGVGVIKMVRFSCIKLSTTGGITTDMIYKGNLTLNWSNKDSGDSDDNYYGYALIGNFDEDIPVVQRNDISHEDNV